MTQHPTFWYCPECGALWGIMTSMQDVMEKTFRWMRRVKRVHSMASPKCGAFFETFFNATEYHVKKDGVLAKLKKRRAGRKT